MKEFGSDFHYVESVGVGKTLFDYFPNASFYANGRQSLQQLITQNKWKRIWIPEYFCYVIVDSIKKNDIQICFYKDNPLSNDELEISKLEFEEGDVLLRMNYFGIRRFRDNDIIKIPVIEDHSHDLIGDWPLNSNADWCFASLRKTLPISEGGILWSPKNHYLPMLPEQTNRNVLLSEKRWRAMRLKKEYLRNERADKEEFRKLFMETESDFDELVVSPITQDCTNFLSNFNMEGWQQIKQRNWAILSDIRSDKMCLVKREKKECNNFSFTLFFRTSVLRENVRHRLILNDIYPAVLWAIPDDKKNAKDISDKMLSIACDGRYNYDEILILKKMIFNVLEDV